MELRRLRDRVADMQVENKNLAYIVRREEEMKKEKNRLEEDGLRALS